MSVWAILLMTGATLSKNYSLFHFSFFSLLLGGVKL